MYVFRLGFLDGYHGLTVCVLSAFYDFVQDAKTREILSGGGGEAVGKGVRQEA